LAGAGRPVPKNWIPEGGAGEGDLPGMEGKRQRVGHAGRGKKKSSASFWGGAVSQRGLNKLQVQGFEKQ